jgi:hypothetical protein
MHLDDFNHFQPFSSGNVLVPRFPKVILLVPGDTVTGGVEAQHQLAYTINKMGGSAELLYFSNDAPFSVEAGQIKGGMQESKAEKAYACYKPIHVVDPVMSPQDLVVFPEIHCRLATVIKGCARAVWWLSVDNALNWNPILSYPELRLSLWTDEKIEHFYQSFYARSFLHEKGVKTCRALFDYINLGGNPVSNDFKQFDVALFPAKGADLAIKFIERYPNLRYCLIENMTTSQVAQALSSSKIYIDFGNQPGKDRVPREAALCGSVVFLHRRGASNHYEDCPIDEFFKFTADDIFSGNLSDRIGLVLESVPAFRSLQANYRGGILQERHEFETQVSKIFFN